LATLEVRVATKALTRVARVSEVTGTVVAARADTTETLTTLVARAATMMTEEEAAKVAMTEIE